MSGTSTSTSTAWRASSRWPAPRSAISAPSPRRRSFTRRSPAASCMRGAEVILHPTSEPGSPRLTIKEVCRRARAIENLVYIVAANTASIDDIPIPPYTCSAMSKIVDYTGHILAEAAAGRRGIQFQRDNRYRRPARASAGARPWPTSCRASLSRCTRRATPRYRFHEGNFLLHDGKVVEPPDRDAFRRRQADQHRAADQGRPAVICAGDCPDRAAAAIIARPTLHGTGELHSNRIRQGVSRMTADR